MISSIQSKDPTADPRVQRVGVRGLRRPQRLHLSQGLRGALPGEPLDRGRPSAGQERLRLRGRAHSGARDPIQWKMSPAKVN